MDTNPVAITYGRTFNNEIATFFVKDVEEAKKVAKEFIEVIPADLDEYVNDIDGWDGKASLVITHQDDDTFYFNATVCGFFLDIEDHDHRDDFTDFIIALRVEDEDDLPTTTRKVAGDRCKSLVPCVTFGS